MTSNTLHPEIAAWGLLIGLWQRRFITRWTIGEINSWRLTIMNEKQAPTAAEGGRRDHGIR